MTRAIFKLVMVVIFTLPLLPLQLIIKLVASETKLFWVLPQFWNRAACWMMGLHVEVHGEFSDKRPLLFIGNHVSYLDILAQSRNFPGYFIAKAEVATWPVFSWLAKLRNTRFVRRDASQVRNQRSALQNDFNKGHSLILYPEGTTTDGLAVKPFKSSLFEAVVRSDVPVAIQPFVIFYDKIDGRPLTDPHEREHVAWYSDIDLTDHIWWLLKKRRVDCRIQLLDPIDVQGMHRKEISNVAWEAVNAALIKHQDPAVAAAVADGSAFHKALEAPQEAGDETEAAENTSEQSPVA